MSNFGAVESLLEQAAGKVFPAGACVVVDAGREVFAQAVGAATLDTVFDVASLTKPLVTTLLCMQLVESGQLSLEETARPDVTVRHLLEHCSGLPAWKLIAPVAGPGDMRARIVDAVRKEPLETAPGTVARYSDLGFILLGDVVERKLGARLDEAFAERVAKPLGIASGFGPVAAERCAPTEGELRGVVHDENARAMDGVAGHAGLFSTARDVGRIVASLIGVRGVQRLVGSETVERFWTPSAVPDSTWCLGWDRPAATGSSAGTRWPRDGVGHLGFTGCSVWIDRRRRRWVVLVSNRVHPSRANEAIRSFRPLLHDTVVTALDGNQSISS